MVHRRNKSQNAERQRQRGAKPQTGAYAAMLKERAERRAKGLSKPKGKGKGKQQKGVDNMQSAGDASTVHADLAVKDSMKMPLACLERFRQRIKDSARMAGMGESEPLRKQVDVKAHGQAKNDAKPSVLMVALDAAAAAIRAEKRAKLDAALKEQEARANAKRARAAIAASKREVALAHEQEIARQLRVERAKAARAKAAQERAKKQESDAIQEKLQAEEDRKFDEFIEAELRNIRADL